MCVKTKSVTYYIALGLWKEYSKGKPKPEPFDNSEIDKWINRIAGADPRTLEKYRIGLERDGYITPIDPDSWIVEEQPKKPKTPSEWMASLKKIV